MKTVKLTEEVHRRLNKYRFRLELERGRCTFYEAVDEALRIAERANQEGEL